MTDDLRLRAKKVKGTEYFSIWKLHKDQKDELIEYIGNLKTLRVKLVKAKKFDEMTNKFGSVVTNLLEEKNGGKD